MTNEDAARILDPETRPDEFQKYQSKKDYMDAVNGACRIAVKALRNIPTGEPLTQDQLQEIDGQPVWIEIIKRLPFKSMWMISDYQTLGVRFDLRDYGQTWLAYSYPPAHINREAWEPCSRCKSCSSCAHFLSNDAYEFCKRCITGQEHIPLTNYCPKCGRPLTQEAWAELENRLRG